ncbi:hypothetical protein EMIHUDRAFT_212951 [Emiliania huxleyi CCMP1516]|uniref:CobW C-terminal domain-containing protein n=2 Tax=Emiliania huxleyi TaxID=2903 RepID=A0A0D3IPK1_EMIH1|nr:hypothetical protein EMIHUDRAFT_212951 [Emiliania huxleyi CCMP1516]EOD13186.1 hypothetical protein EMIHUDRAFT_212951 [Emiliania huxleyi CCMP1516]|eukprot:XP_005765615.1 hypothetical protein EMIHUDRAFT_212951 [Emiliania huxleyi CCMP1516]
MAVTLSAAAAAGSLPRKWGGVFGQERGGDGCATGRGDVESVAVEEAEEAPKFRAVRPFHPGRLHAALQRLASPDVPEERGLRLEGIAWLATQPNLQGLVSTNEAGACVVEPGDPWWAVIPRSKWPEGLEDAIAPLWHEPHGDRQSEVALVWPDDAAEGRCTPSALHAARERWFATLEACVMKPSEDELPLDELDDPFADAWAPVLREAAEQERLAKIADDSYYVLAPTPTNVFAEFRFIT